MTSVRLCFLAALAIAGAAPAAAADLPYGVVTSERVVGSTVWTTGPVSSVRDRQFYTPVVAVYSRTTVTRRARHACRLEQRRAYRHGHAYKVRVCRRG